MEIKDQSDLREVGTSAESRQSHRTSGPSTADGSADGPATAALDGLGPEPASSLTGPAGAFLGDPGEPGPVLGPSFWTHDPDLRWCPRHGAPVRPVGKGICPQHGIFLKSNTVATRNPANVARRDHYRNRLETDPLATLAENTRTLLAGVLERLDTASYGSPEWGRLMDRRDQLTKTLIDALPPPPPEQTDVSELSREDMIARLEEMLVELKAQRAFEQTGISSRYTPSEAIADVPDLAAPDLLVSPAPTVEPAPEPTCKYCNKPPAACASLKATRFDVWEIAHYSDPEVVKKRDDEATAVMLATMRHGSGITRW